VQNRKSSRSKSVEASILIIGRIKRSSECGERTRLYVEKGEEGGADFGSPKKVLTGGKWRPRDCHGTQRAAGSRLLRESRRVWITPIHFTYWERKMTQAWNGSS